MRNMFKVAAIAAAVVLTGCATARVQRWAPDEAPVMQGPRVRANFTPLESAFPCVAGEIKALGKRPPTIAVGDIKDYTGKYSQLEGSTITQGGALMVYSALGKLDGSIQMAERFDTRIAELELAYTDRRQLGDGFKHQVPDPNGGNVVPWLPYYGGTIQRSDYYIVGGITELNYNIQSGGYEVSVSNIGGKRRTYTMSIGADLRIVDTGSLRILKTISLQKQITGEEVGAGIFRFFGDALFDINLGDKNQEPLQLGVRTVLEQATLELIGAVSGVNAPQCIYEASYSPEQRDAAAMRVAVAAALAKERGAAVAPMQPEAAKQGAAKSATDPAAAPVSQQDKARNQPIAHATEDAVMASPLQGMGGAGGAKLQVAFDFGVAALDGRGLAAVAKLAAEAAKGPVDFEIIASDSEGWSPQKREELTLGRIEAITSALAQRGIAASRLDTTWMPAASDIGITRDGAGFQIFAKLRIAPP